MSNSFGKCGKFSEPRGNKLRRLRDNAEEIKRLYWEECWTVKQLAKKYNCSRGLLHNNHRLLGIGGVITSTRCGKEKHWNWKGGRTPTPDGVVIRDGGRLRLEHCLIAEKILGRKMKDDEVVHHINGNRYDNRNCNLLICNQTYHVALHYKMSKLYQQQTFGG